MLPILLLVGASSAHAQGAAAPSISSPLPGQVLQGQIPIVGTSDVPGYASAELAFAYAGDLTGTWFVIQAGVPALTDAVLGTWDTNSISDGDYILRLRLSLQDGSLLEVLVAGLQVRNYTAPPTLTPEAVGTPTATPTPRIDVPTAMVLAASPTPTPPPPPSPSPLPPNPAALTTAEIYASLQRGALAIGLLFLAFGILLRLRRP